MADTIEVGAVKFVEVNGRDPFADEAVTVDDAAIVALDSTTTPGRVTATAVAAGTATVTVAPGSEDAGFSAGSDTITVTEPAPPPTPLTVTLSDV